MIKKTTYALYVRHTLMLYFAFVSGCVGFLILVGQLLYPYYCDDIYKETLSGFSKIEHSLKSALLHHDYTNAYRVFEQMKSIENPIHSELHLFSLHNYEIYGIRTNCKGTLTSLTWGAVCLDSSRIRMEIPIKTADNTLGHVTLLTSANMFYWAPYRLIMISVLIALLVFSIFSAWLVRVFHRKYAVPIENMVQNFSSITTDTEAIQQLERIPFQELHDLSYALVMQSTRLRSAHRMIQQLRLQAEYAELSSQLSHDVNHQVCTIGLLLDTAQINQSSKESIRKVLTKIRVNLENKLRNFNEVRFLPEGSQNGSPDGSKIAEQPLENKILDKSSSNLIWVIESILSEQQVVAQAKGVVLLASLPPSLQSYEIEFDTADLDRILLNLISNGVDAAHENQENALSQVLVTVTLDKKVCKITVKDSGKGFRKDVLEQIILRRSTTTKTEGLGIGLLSVQTLIDKIGGEIHFHSDAHGAGVRVLIPIKDESNKITGVLRSM